MNEPLMLTATAVVLGVPEPHGTRLAQTIESRLGLACTVTANPSECDPGAWVLTTPAWADRLLQQGLPANRMALVWGSRPMDSQASRWSQQGMTILTGAMPRPALDWLQRTATADSLAWDDTDESATHMDWDDVGPAAPPRITPSHRPSAVARGLSIAVYSSGGGVGKTTTAVYLATIASQHRIHTGLIELDENRSGVLTYWDRKAPYGGLDSVKPGDWSDPERLAAQLDKMAVTVAPRLTAVSIVGTSEGLQYHPEDASRDLGHLFTWARAKWGLTIYDLPATVRDTTVYHTLQSVDRVLFVVEPTEIMLESSLRYLRIIEALGDVGQQIIAKTGLVINKVPKARQARLDPALMAESLALPLWGQIAEQTVRYMAAINHHKIAVTPEWQKLWVTLGLSPTGSTLAPTGDSKRRFGEGWLYRKKEA